MAVRFTKLFMTVSLLLTAVAADSPGIAFQGGKTGHAPDIVERLDTTATGKPALTSSKNVGVSEYGLDGHVDDVVFATKDGLTIFLVSTRTKGHYINMHCPCNACPCCHLFECTNGSAACLRLRFVFASFTAIQLGNFAVK